MGRGQGIGRGALTMVVVAVLAGAGCSDDDTSAADAAEAATATSEPTEESEGTTTTVAAASSGGTSAGSVTIGSTEYGFDPTIQCSLYPGGVVSIAGTAVDDPDVEIVFDAFEPGRNQLSVTGPDFQWMTTTSDFEVEIDDPEVRGTAEVQGVDGTTEESSFTFRCG